MSIHVGRIQDIEVIPNLKENLVFEEGQTPEKFVELVKTFLEHSPDKIQIIAAEREGKVVGFSISFDLGAPHIWISQFWNDPQVSSKVADEMFLRVLN